MNSERRMRAAVMVRVLSGEGFTAGTCIRAHYWSDDIKDAIRVARQAAFEGPDALPGCYDAWVLTSTQGAEVAGRLTNVWHVDPEYSMQRFCAAQDAILEARS